MRRCLITLFTLLFLIQFGFAGKAQALVVASDVNASTHWTIADSPVSVTDVSFIVGPNATLSIDPGVTVNFAGSFTVRGRLDVQGISTNTITFGELNAGSGWGPLTFTRQAGDNTTSSTSVLEYISITGLQSYIYLDRRNINMNNCDITITGSAPYGIHAYSDNGAAYPETTLSITNNTISMTSSNNSATIYGIHIDGANTTFTGNDVTMSLTGSGFYGIGFTAEITNTEEYNLTLENNTFDITSTNTNKQHVYGISIKDYGVFGDINDNNITIVAPHEIHGIDSTGDRDAVGNFIDITSSDALDTAEREVFGIYFPSTASESLVSDNEINIYSDSARSLYGIYAQHGYYTNNRITLESDDVAGILIGIYHSYYPAFILNNSVSLDASTIQLGYGIYFGTKFTDNTVTAKNNLLYSANGSNFTGFYKASGNPSDLDVDYNLIYNFNTNYDGLTQGTHDLFADPDFDDATQFTVNAGSPVIDGGDWDSEYSNEPAPNGGRINIGAWGNTSSAETSVALVPPEITTNNGANFTNPTNTITLQGKTSLATSVIYVNNSTSGVSYTAGDSDWSYTGTLAAGTNNYSVRARDTSNNNSDTDSITVTYIDTLAPQIVSVSPAQGADDVSIDATITILFTEAMRGSSLTSSNLYIEDVPGTVTASGNTAIITPDEPLTHFSTYTVVITTDVEDQSGNNLASAYTWTFDTAEETSNGSGLAGTGTGDGGDNDSNTDDINGSGGSSGCSLIMQSTSNHPNRFIWMLFSLALVGILYLRKTGMQPSCTLQKNPIFVRNEAHRPTSQNARPLDR